MLKTTGHDEYDMEVPAVINSRCALPIDVARVSREPQDKLFSASRSVAIR